MPTTYAIPNGRTVMDATTYTGTSSTQNIVNAGGFKPDLVWTKSRTNPASGYLNILSDSVRGQTSGYYNNLYSDATYAQNVGGAVLPASQGGITTLNSNGFTLANGSAPAYWQNESGYTYVAWQWQAGQGTTSTNTAGSQTSTVSVNATAGFSIVTFTATGVNTNGTVGHGLGVTPKLIIVKNSASESNWVVYSSAVVTNVNQFLRLNDTSALTTLSQIWGDALPTSTVFGIRGDVTLVANSAAVAYCWAEIAGFSQFNSYTGNGSTDGTFVYTGFRPKFVMIKSSSIAGSYWVTQDTSRNTYNVMNSVLYPNSNSAEATTINIDALSNGFKLRTTSSDYNQNGSTYIYMAFAENPFKYANAR